MLVGHCFEVHLAGISTINPQRRGSFLTRRHLTLEIEKVQLGTQDCVVRAVTTVCHWSTVMQWAAILEIQLMVWGHSVERHNLGVAMYAWSKVNSWKSAWLHQTTEKSWSKLWPMITAVPIESIGVPPPLYSKYKDTRFPTSSLLCGLARNRGPTRERTVLKA